MTRTFPIRAVIAVVACVLAASLVVALEWSRRRANEADPVHLAPPPIIVSAPPIAQVVAAVREMKLVTWQFETTVDATSVSDRWYGDAVANIRAPVRYQYGVDLARLEPDDILLQSAAEHGSYVFIVPPPQRISVEVDIDRLEQTLETSGLRRRSANQSQLDLARKQLAARAKEMTLSPDDANRLREVSREQLGAMIHRIVGSEATVQVRFAE